MRTRVLVIVSVLVVVGFIGWAVFRQAPVKPNQKDGNQTGGEVAGKSLAPGRIIIGGVERPDTDVGLAAPSGSTTPSPPIKRQGHSTALPADLNPQVKQVAEAQVSRTQPERFSSFVVPKSFDNEAFKQDPAGYATKYAQDIEPGRVFATAQPGENVSPIRGASSKFHRVKQGESVRLGVKAIPNAPVTFTSFKLGQFENSLTSITVVANEEGVATANYTASGGTVDEVQILAASPATSGQVAFTVAVKLGS